MALTVPQLNAHLRTMLADELDHLRLRDQEVLHFLLRACIRHHRLGGVDNIEAAQTVAQFVAQQTLGRAPTAADLHLLREHWVLEADETAGGTL